MAWLAGWSYRKEITVTGETGAGTDYQVQFNIGDAAGGDFHLEGHCTNFPQDIEVTDNDGTTLLDYWIEDITADPLKLWVKVADDLGTNQTIYVYYGKSGATTGSDITNTFIFGDDFEYDDAITNHGWLSGASVTSTDYAKTGTRSLKVSSTNDDKSDYNIGNNEILEFDFYDPNIASSNIYIGIEDITEGTYVAVMKYEPWSSGYYLTRYGAADYDISSVSQSQAWHTGKIIHTTGGSITPYIDNVVNPTRTIAGSTKIIRLYGYGLWYADNVRTRKYLATEPAFSSAGSEETPVTQATTLLHGKIRIKDSTTNLVDGKVQIQDTVTGLVDGLIKIQDTATGHSDGLLIVQDTVTGLVDGKVQIQDTTINLVDGKVIVSLVSAGTDQADGKIRIKDVTTGIVDGLIKVTDTVTNLADGKLKVSNIGSNLADGLIKIKDTVTGLTDGKIIITEGETSTNLFNGLLRIKDKATGIVDGLLRIIEKPINLADSKIILVDDFNGPFTATITDSQEYTAAITNTQEYTAAITDTQEYTAVIS